jgi:hypothetical protein
MSLRIRRLHHDDVFHPQRLRRVPPHQHRLHGYRVGRERRAPTVHVCEEQRNVVLVEREPAVGKLSFYEQGTTPGGRRT